MNDITKILRDWRPGDPVPDGFAISLRGRLYHHGQSEERRKALLEVMRSQRPMMEQIRASKPFSDRGLSARTIQALADCSIDYPERLLFMTEKQIASIPGVGKVAAAEIRAYRALFIISEAR